MAITDMYHTCFDKIRQLRPKEPVTRVRNMAWLLVGMLGPNVKTTNCPN